MARLGPFDLNEAPCVVGSVVTRGGLVRLLSERSAPCDIVELRLDQLCVEGVDWVSACRTLHDAGLTQLVTLRHAEEGGVWRLEESSRLGILEPVLDVIEAADVEIRQPDAMEVIEAVHEAGGIVIGSFHDFETTPSFEALTDIVRQGLTADFDVVKSAVCTEQEEDLAVLERLLHACNHVPLAVLGMGRLGTESRVSLATHGSCLTYGFLDEAAAPGQIYAGDLKVKLSEAHPVYRKVIGHW